jgi:epoxyqueuosine reductase
LIREQLAVEALQEHAKKLGFVVLGIADAEDSPDYQQFCEWLDRGYSGSMEYLQRRREAYRHPRNVLEGCRSIVMLAMPYAKHPRTLRSKGFSSQDDQGESDQNSGGTIASYASGLRDYHDVIHDRHEELVALLDRMFPEMRSRGVVDTAPLLERSFGRLAGLGWQGKNTLLLNRELGSYFFLSAILTQAQLLASDARQTDHCGTCRACLDACPTQAFPSPHVLDATRCISYWTIEHRGSIPEEVRHGISEWLFGCDVCQMVCPWNRKPELEVDRELSAESWDEKVDCLFWLGLDEQGFRERFRRTPFWRTRLEGMQRNAMIVAANTGRLDAKEAIERLVACGDPVLEETARWSLKVLASRG